MLGSAALGRKPRLMGLVLLGPAMAASHVFKALRAKTEPQQELSATALGLRHIVSPTLRRRC